MKHLCGSHMWPCLVSSVRIYLDNYYIFGGLIITLISNLQGNAQDKMCYRNVSQCMTKDKSLYHIGWKVLPLHPQDTTKARANSSCQLQPQVQAQAQSTA